MYTLYFPSIFPTLIYLILQHFKNISPSIEKKKDSGQQDRRSRLQS